MGYLDGKRLKALMAKPPARHPDGGGLYFKVSGGGRAYFTYRYTLKGREHEISLGAFPETKLDEARIRHLRLVADVAEGIDPAAAKQTAKAAKGGKAIVPPSGKPTFGDIVETCLEKKDGELANPKSRQQWAMTLRKYAKPLHDKPVDQVDTPAVVEVLKPLWTTVPETASRLRGRIEFVLAAAQVAGHIDPNRTNPARWKGWLEHMLPKRKRLSRGHHAAMPYADLPQFMAKLAETPHVAARALQFAILTCARSGEVFGMKWDEVDDAVWRVPASRMKMQRLHEVPLSGPALAILDEMRALRWNDHPFVFAGQRPRKGLSNMAMEMCLRRMGADAFTVHGMRSAARSWMADTGVQFELAEACLAHTVGNAVVQAYQRSSMLERRRPVMSAWARFLTDHAADRAAGKVEASTPERVPA